MSCTQEQIESLHRRNEQLDAEWDSLKSSFVALGDTQFRLSQRVIDSLTTREGDPSLAALGGALRA